MNQLFKKAALFVVASIMMSTPALALTCGAGLIKSKDRDPVTHKFTCVQPTPDEGWQLLLDGNKKFTHNNLANTIVRSKAKARAALAAGQKPYAIVLTCSDSRVPPEILFDKGLGEVFTIRVAGNVVSPHEMGSIDYAVEHLKSNLIVVLGHEKCGAVKATYDYYPEHIDTTAEPQLTNIASLTDSIFPSVATVVLAGPGGTKPADATAQAAQVEECVIENIKRVGGSLEGLSTIVTEAKDGTLVYGDGSTIKDPLVIKYARYDLDTGLVTEVTP